MHFEHSVIVREYGDEELLATRRLSVLMIRHLIKCRLLAKTEQDEAGINIDIGWWKEHNEAMSLELDRRIYQQN